MPCLHALLYVMYHYNFYRYVYSIFIFNIIFILNSNRITDNDIAYMIFIIIVIVDSGA